MKILLLIFIFSLTIFSSILAQKSCIRTNYDGPEPRMVCVCNSTYCDEFPQLIPLNGTQAAIYTTSKSWKRFDNTTAFFEPVQNVSEQITIKVYDWIKFQSVIGFGGTFTDAVDINLDSLDRDTRENLLEAYFGEKGIGYSLGRVPIGSTDFSVTKYSYDDVLHDFTLQNFSLTREDLAHKIPNIVKAMNLTNNSLNLFATPWSAPGWMKSNHDMLGRGQIKGDLDGPYYKVWASYLQRFFEEYSKIGINFWGMTLQNKPYDLLDLEPNKYQKMNMDPKMQRDFLKGILGPMFKNSPLTKDLKIMIHDDDRRFLPGSVEPALNDKEASKFVDGIAVQWYDDYPWNSAEKLADLYEKFQGQKFILSTEAANGYLPFLRGPYLGDWSRGVAYASDIIQTFKNFSSGWTDYNLCLDLQGGPSWVESFLDSPIIVNSTADEFYKQPMYYMLGHFSKFVRPYSDRVALDIKQPKNGLDAVAFTTPENRRVVVLQNTLSNETYSIGIQDPYIGMDVYVKVELEPNSIATIVWNKPNID